MTKALSIRKKCLNRKGFFYCYVIAVMTAAACREHFHDSNIHNQNEKHDTATVIHLNKTGWQYVNQGIYDSAMIFARRSLFLCDSFYALDSTKQFYYHARVSPYNTIAAIHYYKGEFSEALENWSRALKINQDLGDKNGISVFTGNIGLVFWNQGLFPKALEYFFTALKIDEALGDSEGVARHLGNIGLLYWNQMDYAKSTDYNLRALKMNEAINNKSGIAMNLGNLANVLADMAYVERQKGHFSEALQKYSEAQLYNFKSLKIEEELGDQYSMAIRIGNIGSIYNDQAPLMPDVKRKKQMLDTAMNYYFIALKTCIELEDTKGIARHLGNIGSLYATTGLYKDAYRYLFRALHLSDSIGEINHVREVYNFLSQLYETSDLLLPDSGGMRSLTTEKMRDRALYYYKRSIAIRDTLFNKENRNQILQKELSYEFEKKEAAARAEHEKVMAVAASESRRQRLMLWFITAVAIAVALIAGVIFRSLRVTRKQKKIIEKQKSEVVEKNEMLLDAHEKISHQKKVIEEKNRDITDSITYASYIQRAILTPEEAVRKSFQGCFIFYQPKDIVSGDFYWFHSFPTSPAGRPVPSPEDAGRKHSHPSAIAGSTIGWQGGDGGGSMPHPWGGIGGLLLACCDCTGHGVPGAFLSMIGNDLFNQVVKNENISGTGSILDELNSRFSKTLRPVGSQRGIKDTMETGLCIIDISRMVLEYSGAKRPLILVRNGVLQDIPADPFSIGDTSEPNIPFTSHSFPLHPGDAFYLFSDGFGDQFGGSGSKSKKFGTKRLRELLTAIAAHEISQQKIILEKTFNDWKSDNEQVDDVLVIGVKV